jgi:hypothetical protein
MAERGATFLRPDRKARPPASARSVGSASGSSRCFGPARASSVSSAPGARTLPGLCARVGLRLLAFAAALWHNAEIGQPGRCFSAYTG